MLPLTWKVLEVKAQKVYKAANKLSMPCSKQSAQPVAVKAVQLLQIYVRLFWSIMTASNDVLGVLCL